MTATKVAVVGDTTATPSTAPTLNGAPGAWTAGPVTEQSYAQLTIGGIAVIHSATCVFTFTPQSGSPIPASVTLSASSTPLQQGQTNVLLNGDQMTDQNGNQLMVTASTTALTSTH
jgi:hypothetical protein